MARREQRRMTDRQTDRERKGGRTRERGRGGGVAVVVVCWLLNVPATCEWANV